MARHIIELQIPSAARTLTFDFATQTPIPFIFVPKCTSETRAAIFSKHWAYGLEGLSTFH